MTSEGSLFDAQPEAFGPYRCQEEIASAPFGPAYRAQESPHGPVVALKVFDQGLLAEQAAGVAKALQRLCSAPLDHPSIVAPLAAGATGDVAWVAEPFIDGTPLDRVLRREGPQPLGEMLLRITQVAGALDFAAAVGIFHGALQPRDILVAGDRTLLTGLGTIQALSEAGLDVPLHGPTVSRQRALGLPPMQPDDIYSLAAITVEVVYGRPVVDRRALGAIVTPITGIDDARLRDVLEGSLAEDPADRPATALEFAGALQQVLLDNPRPSGASVARVHDAPQDRPDRPVAAASPSGRPDDAPPANLRGDFADHEPGDEPDIALPIHAGAEPVVVDLPLRTDESRTAGVLFDEPGPERRPAHTHEFGAVERHAPMPFEAESASRRTERQAPVTAPRVDVAASRPMFGAEADTARERGLPWLAMTACIAIGLLAGFAAGFIVGQRDATPIARMAERVVPRAQREAPADGPASTTGQEYSESAVTIADPDLKPTEPGVAPQPAAPPPPAPTAPAATAPATTVPAPAGAEPAEPRVPDRTAPAGPERAVPSGDAQASLEVVSRPAGAQVFVDGRLVGTTPLVLSDVAAGSYGVRIALPGHKRWVTTVNVPAGSRARVAASLER